MPHSNKPFSSGALTFASPDQSSLAEKVTEFVKHLRLIHFSLVTSCVACIFGALASENPHYEAALKELATVKTASSILAQNYTFVKNVAEERLNQLDAIDKQSVTKVPQLIKVAVTISNDKTAHSVNIRLTDNTCIAGAGEITGAEFDNANNYEAFEKAWNRLAGKDIYFPLGIPLKADSVQEVYIEEISSDQVFKDFTGKIPSIKILERIDGLAFNSKLNCQKPFSISYTSRARIGEKWYDISMSMNGLPKPFRFSDAVNKLTGLSLTEGLAKDQFPHLAKTLENLESISYDNAKKYIEAKLKDPSQQFSVGGIILPAKYISIGGSLLIISIQLYFLMHFIALMHVVSKADVSYSSPWIFLYQDILAKITASLSTALLPTGSIAFILFTRLEDLQIVFWFLPLISAAIGVWTQRIYCQLHEP